MRFLPYLSERDPIMGDTMNWRVLWRYAQHNRIRDEDGRTYEKTEPIIPPVAIKLLVEEL